MKTRFQPLMIAFFLLLGYYKEAKAQTSGYSGTGSNIDVVYHRAQWRINPDSSVKAIGGSVTTYFVTKQAAVTAITFDLNSVFTSVTATCRGAAITITRPSANVIRLALPAALPVNTLDSVTIFYNGIPPATAQSGAAVGFQKATYTATTPSAVTQNYIYTLSESYEDRDWWPCKADMQDKVDSMDIIVSTPWVGADTFWVATNGKLTDSSIRGNSRIFTFKNRYPMASYLVSLGIARYNRYYRTVNISGTNVPVVYNLFRGQPPATYTTILNAMDGVNGALTAFSTKFGDYPFKTEKHGFYEGLGGAGGMEHQTFSAIATGSISHVPTLVHELMHQWFGDQVTFATWNHLWLAEGFARYSESLVGELVPALGITPFPERSANKASTLATYYATPLIIPAAGIVNSGGIWNGTYGGAVYEKGAMVVSMLRKLAGDDKFYEACRNYLSDPALSYKAATTNNLKEHFEAVLNCDLDPFFTDYTQGIGNPAYDINWGNSGTGINIELTTQRRNNGSTVTYFRTPVVLRISNASKDTTVVIYDQNGQLSYAGKGIQGTYSGKVLGYNLSFVPTTVTVDPNAETLVRGQDGQIATTTRVAQSTVAKVTRLNTMPLIILDVNIIDFTGRQQALGNVLTLFIASTTENIHTTIERSEDGIHFYSLGAMSKTSSTAENIKFSFTDKTILNNTVYYYRAKTVDEKGTVNISKIISIARKEGVTTFKLSPNPAADFIHIAVPAAWQNQTINYAVYTSAGILIKNEKEMNAGSSVKFSVRQLPAGNYTLKMSGATGEPVAKGFSVIH